MTPTASAAIQEPCHSDRIRGRLVGGVAHRHREGRHVVRRARGERGEEQTAERERSACAPHSGGCAGRTQRAPSMGRAGGHSRRSSARSAPYSRGHSGGGSGRASASSARYAGRGDLHGAQRREVLGRPLHVEQPASSPSAAAGRPAPTSATFDASRSRWNIDSPANSHRSRRRTARRRAGRPRATSRRCAPSRARAAAGRPPRRRGVIQPPGRVGSAQARDHLVERGVDADLVAPARPAQRAADPQPVERQHAARVRRPPADGPPPCETGIGNSAGPVGGEQRARLEVGADPDQLLARRRPTSPKLPARRRRLDRGTCAAPCRPVRAAGSAGAAATSAAASAP